MTVADYAQNPDIPFAVIGTEAVLKGQGTAISWNPYVAAAKFVLHQVKGQNSINDGSLVPPGARKLPQSPQ